MTVWLCDRCGKQTGRIAQGAGKYAILKTIFDDGQRRQRAVRLCDECSTQVEKFLDDEFAQIPEKITVEIDRRN